MATTLTKNLRTGAVAAGLLSVGLYEVMRAHRIRLLPKANPASDYAQALAIIDGLARKCEDALNPRCNPSLLTHGHKTERAIAFIHGYTNCPHQFSQLAPLFYERGYNVYSARLPQHGLADRLSPLQGKMRATDMVHTTETVVDTLRGLGEHVTLFGFSMGGVLAAWAAQRRSELDHVVMLAPSLSVKAVPLPLRQTYANMLTVLPNVFQWWNPELKDAKIEPMHAYPRWSSRAVGAMLRLGGVVELIARSAKPAAKQITLIVNPCDETVDNRAAYALAERWHTYGTPVRTYEFPKEWNLIHDLVDPEQPKQQMARVYPKLVEWAGAENDKLNG